MFSSAPPTPTPPWTRQSSSKGPEDLPSLLPLRLTIFGEKGLSCGVCSGQGGVAEPANVPTRKGHDPWPHRAGREVIGPCARVGGLV